MLTLRVRLILVFTVVLFVSGLFTWFGVRPSYESALVDERISLITEYQQQRVSLAEAREPVILPSHNLPQAEAMCFSADGRALLVASEKSRNLLRYELR